MHRKVALTAGSAAVIGLVALATVAHGTPAPHRARATRALRSGGVLTALYTGDVDSTDPGITYYNASFQVTRATQRTLVTPRPDGSVVPDLAAAMPEVSPDGRTVTVHLRSGVRFSPPVDREVTADDVRYAIERGFFRTVANPYVGAYFAGIVGARSGVAPGTRIPGIETPDAHTVVFHLRRATGRVLAEALVLPLSAPVPRAYAARCDADTPSTYAEHVVATGPYMIANNALGRLTGYRAGREIRLVRNPNWDPATDFRPAHLDGIDIREGNANSAAAARRVLAGRGLVVGDFPTPAGILRRAVRRDPSQVRIIPGGGFDFTGLNTTIKPLDDVNVRRAINAATDRRALRAALGGPLVASIATHIIPPGVAGFRQAGGYSASPLGFVASAAARPALAARYMRRAGYPTGRYTGTRRLLVVGSNDAAGAAVARLVAGTLRGLGFPLRLRLLRLDKQLVGFCERPSAHVAVCPNAAWFKDFGDPQTILDPPFNGENIVPEVNPNIAQLKVPALDRAMDAAKLLVDPAQRARAWAAIDRRVLRQAPGTGWLWQKQAFVSSKDVVAVPNRAGETWDFAFMALR